MIVVLNREALLTTRAICKYIMYRVTFFLIKLVPISLEVFAESLYTSVKSLLENYFRYSRYSVSLKIYTDFTLFKYSTGS